MRFIQLQGSSTLESVTLQVSSITAIRITGYSQALSIVLLSNGYEILVRDIASKPVSEAEELYNSLIEAIRSEEKFVILSYPQMRFELRSPVHYISASDYEGLAMRGLVQVEGSINTNA